MADNILTKLGGRFIVVDGPDGAGKSTQISMLAEHLLAAGLEVVKTRDPGGTAIGDKIRAILLDNDHHKMSVACETMLYMASRAQLVHEVIRAALDRGSCVLCDRFVSSTIAYQGAGGADTAAIRQVAEIATGNTWPDLTVILDLGAEEGLKRAEARAAAAGKLDRMEAKGADFHKRVREMFLEQARQDPDHFRVVDASGGAQEVQDRLRQTIKQWVAQSE